jgi:WD40 repeat protein
VSERRLKRRYELQSLLARGVATDTHLALDHQTGERCVVKVLSLASADALKAHELLTREARVLQRLDHPRIPRLVDFFSEDDGPRTRVCLVQQHIDGKSLLERVRAGRRFGETEALALGVELARVLEYLHGFDPPILHRDLKPANVLVTPRERVYVVDFGAVRDHLPHEMLHPSGPTIVGTRGYMPIEQFEGRAVPGSDLYALGATLVFALSGKEPGEIGKEGLRLDFAPHVAVSPGFERLLGRLLEPDWRERPLSATEVRDELERLAGLARRPRPGPSVRPARPWLLAIGALVAVAGLGIAFLGTRRPPSAPPASRAAKVPARKEPPALKQARRPWPAARIDGLGDPLPPGALRRFGTVRLRHGGPVRGLAVTPDGAGVVSASEDSSVSVWNAATGEERLRFPLGAKPSALALSPDGSRLLVGEEWQWTARLWELPGGRPLARLLAASPRRDVPAAVFAVAVAREAPLVATLTEDAVDLWSKADGRHVRRLPGCGRGRGLAFLDRDRALLVDCPDGSFRVLEASSGAERRRLNIQASGPLLVAPGEELLAATSHGRVSLFDLATGMARGALGDGEVGASYVTATAFAADARRLAVGLGSGTVVVFDVVTRVRARVLESPGGAVSAIAFSPDGGTLVAATGHGISPFDLESGRPLVPGGSSHAAVQDLDFSPDGDTVLAAGADGTIRRWDGEGRETAVGSFDRPATAIVAISATRLVAVEEGRVHVYDVASGWEVTGAPLPATRRPGVAVAPRAGLLAAGGASSLQVVDLARGARRSFPVPRAEEALAFSPDGRVVATLREEAERLAGRPLVLRDAASGRELGQVAHNRGGPFPFRCRSADGSYLGFNGGVWRVGHDPKARLETVGWPGRARLCAVSPDGRRFAFSNVDDPDAIEIRERVEAASGRSELAVRGQLRGHRGPVTSMAFAPDSRTLATGGADTTVLLWDVGDASAFAAEPPRAPRREPRFRASFDGGIEGPGGAGLRLAPDSPLRLVPGYRGQALSPAVPLAFPELGALAVGEAFTLLVAFRLEGAALSGPQPRIVLDSRLATLDVRDDGLARLFLHYPQGGHLQADLTPWVGRVAAGRWYHVALAASRSSGSVRICVDGVCGPGPSPWRPMPGRIGELTLARSTPGQAFPGAIDELALYDRALGDDEMAAAAGRPRALALPPPTPPPTPTPLPRRPAEQEPLPREGLPEGKDVAAHVSVEERDGFTVYRFGGPLARAQPLDVDLGLGALWVGTSLGLLRHDPRGGSWRLWDEAAGLSGERLDEVAVVAGRVVVDSSTPTTPGNVRGTGVLSFDVASRRWTAMKDVSGVWDLWADGSTLWVATSRGAEARDLETGALRRFTRSAGELVHDDVHALRRHGETVAFATLGDYVGETKAFVGGGVTLWDRRRDSFRSYTEKDGLARDYSCDVFLDDDDVFVAHWDEERGLSRIDRRTGRVEVWPRSANGIDLGGVVLAGEPGTLWIGQQGALVRVDRASRHARALRERDGLPGSIVSGIAVGEDAVWASVYALASDGVRSSGLARFPRRRP